MAKKSAKRPRPSFTAVASIKGLYEQRRRYEGRIALLDQKTEGVVGRQFRAGQRWLRHSETL